MSKYMDLYTKNPRKFIDKYCDFSKKSHIRAKDRLEALDRPQARLVIHPELFTNEEYVKINQFTRFEASDETKTSYYAQLKKLVHDDIQQYIEDLNEGKSEDQKGSKLNKLNKMISHGNLYLQQKETREKKIKEDYIYGNLLSAYSDLIRSIILRRTDKNHMVFNSERNCQNYKAILYNYRKAVELEVPTKSAVYKNIAFKGEPAH